jgi:hypothetical protein
VERRVTSPGRISSRATTVEIELTPTQIRYVALIFVKAQSALAMKESDRII